MDSGSEYEEEESSDGGAQESKSSGNVVSVSRKRGRPGRSGEGEEGITALKKAKKETMLTDAKNIQVQYAASARSKCVTCGGKIEKGVLRIGVKHKDPRGEDGYIVKWSHLECSRFNNLTPDDAPLFIDFELLDVEEQEAVRAMLAFDSNTAPEHLKPVDPDDLIAKRAAEIAALPPVPPPADLVAQLLSFQQTGLNWMVSQETGGPRGGILADEMGMGKTLQAIALVLANRPRGDASGKGPAAVPPSESKYFSGIVAPKIQSNATLIICPVVALLQWHSEIVKFTEPFALNVGIFHGPKRSLDAASLAKYDIILTSYSTIEAEYRKDVEKTKVKCDNCGKKFLPNKLAIHLAYFCGADAQLTEKQAKTERKSGGKGGVSVKSRSKQASQKKGKGKAKFNDDESEEEFVDESETETEEEEVVVEEEEEEEEVEAPAKSAKKKKGTLKKVTKRVARKGDSDSDESDTPLQSKSVKGNKGGSAKKRMSFQKTIMEAAKEKKMRGGKGATPPPAKKGATPSKKMIIQVVSDSESDGGVDLDDETVSEDDFDLVIRSTAASSSAKKSSTTGATSSNPSKGPLQVSNSTLHKVKWHRIILDEAHAIKNRASGTAAAIFQLQSTYRWCLSGTPLQNRVGEFYSLLRFLQVDPFAFYFCKKCDCKSLHYRFGPRHDACEEPGCGHPPLHHYSIFNRDIVNPIKKYGYVGEGRTAMMTLKGKVLDSLLLRRVKSNFTNEMLLPPKIVVIRRELFDEKEDDFYQAIYTKSTAQFNAYVTQGTLLNNYAHIFDLLIRLRQAVDHPYLVLYSKTGDEEVAGGGEKGSETMICGICHEDIDHLSVSKCHHTFCLSCIREYISSKMEDAELTCPTCYAPLSVDISGQTNTARIGRRNILSRVSLANFTSSTKIEALMEEVHRMLEKDPCSKGIVFSQFVNMLDIIEYRLQKGGIKVVKLTGGMTVTARDRVISAFKEDPAVTIFLVSLKAGGVALNLTVASNVFLMDPWWNPAAEYQAIDRAHRLGQFKTIRATRFIIENSIEDRILALQEKKRLVFEGTIGGDNSALGKLTVEDLQFLFQN